MIKVSVVMNVLNSHEVVRRQIEYYKKMGLPNNIEVIFVDDGSNPPLSFPDCGLRNLSIYYTNDKRPWTQGLARNLGAEKAQGEYIMFTDIDHFYSKDSIEAVSCFTGDKMVFLRYYAILDENGDVVDDINKMIEFGLDPNRIKGRRGVTAGFHGNSYAIRKNVFWMLGGYKERWCNGMMHQGKRKGEDSFFNWKYTKAVHANIFKPAEVGPKMYMFPIGKFRTDGDNNPFGLFHSLSHEPVPQPMME